MHSSSRNRKCDSGALKHRRKQKLEIDAQSQRGAHDKFVVKGSQTNSEKKTPDANIDDGHDDDAVEVEVATTEIHDVEENEVLTT